MTAAEPQRSAFGPGEQTTYQVRFMGVPTGIAQVTVGWTMEQFGREVWPLVCVGETTDLAAAYPVHDRFISYWDPTTRAPVGADFVVDENKKRRRERYEYTQDGRAVVTRQRAGAPIAGFEYAAEAGTTDLASAAFSLRNEALEVGSTHRMPVFLGTRFYKLLAKVEAKETLSGPLGPFEVLRVSVNAEFTGNLETRRNMTLWYTADERHLPVRAEAEFALGSVTIEAVKYEAGRAITGAR